MSSQPPNPLPPGSPPSPPPGVPPQVPQWPNGWPVQAAAPRESRGVAFFVAIFLGILLVASAGLNVLLLLLSLGSLTGSGLGDVDSAVYDEVYVTGVRGGRDKVLQIGVRGAIAESGSPVLGAAGGSVSQVKRGLRMAAADDVLGVLLYVDSPGGGVTDSDEIWRLVRKFRREHPQKPVVALFGDLAASGGYYVAAACERITAHRSTITGSIGVIMSGWNFAEAAKKFGVEQIAIKSERTPFKDILSPTRAMREDERALLTALVDELLDQFIAVVDEGRDTLDRAAATRVANGAIYSASQALELGLVDEIGDLDTVLAWFDRRLGKAVTIVEPRRRAGLGDLLFGAFGGKRPEASLPDLLTSSTGPRFLYYWQGGR